jgi:hypothetical protein
MKCLGTKRIFKLSKYYSDNYFSTAIDSVCSPARVKSAFSKSGMYPVDIGAVDQTQIQTQTDASEKHTGRYSSNSGDKFICIKHTI